MTSMKRQHRNAPVHHLIPNLMGLEWLTTVPISQYRMEKRGNTEPPEIALGGLRCPMAQ